MVGPMSVGLAGVKMLLPALVEAVRRPGSRVLVLGTQDLVFHYDEALEFLRAEGVAVREVPPEERRHTNSFAHVPHGDWWRYKNYLHQDTLFRMLGFEPGQLRTLDVDDYEHADLLHDLNEPVPPALGEFDLVIDQGTLEHVFDIRQALWNLCDLTREGGQVVHMVPASMLEHGFYNFNPYLFADFYRQAGWRDEQLVWTLSPVAAAPGAEIFAPVPVGKISSVPPGFYLNIFGRFRKLPGATRPVARQGIYEVLHEAWNHQSRAQSVMERPADAVEAPPGLLQRLREAWQRRAVTRAMRRLGADPVVISRRSAYHK
jgi:SAM-dependent methyltransferase